MYIEISRLFPLPILLLSPSTSFLTEFSFVLLHQGIKLVHNTSANVIITNQSLVLQNVGRSMAGNISCHAYNVEGQAESHSIFLDVKCKFSFFYFSISKSIDDLMSKNEQQMRPFARRDWRVTLACLGQRTLKSFVKWKPIRARNSSTNGSSTTRRRRSKCHGVATTTATHQGPAYSPTSRWLRSTMARSSASPLTRPAVKTSLASSTFWLQVSDKISDITIIVHTYKLYLCNSSAAYIRKGDRKWKRSVCLLLLASSKLCHNILNIIYHMYTHIIYYIYATYVRDSSGCIIVAHG